MGRWVWTGASLFLGLMSSPSRPSCIEEWLEYARSLAYHSQLRVRQARRSRDRVISSITVRVVCVSVYTYVQYSS